MKKIFSTVAACMLATISAFAQYNVGTSTTTKTDMFGNTVTTHRDEYGRTTGTSTTSRTDMFGNTTTTHRDAYGRTIGTSTTGRTDMFGNTTTTHRNEYGQTTGTSTTGRTDMFGNTTTTHRNSYGLSTGTSTTGRTDMFGNTTTTHRNSYGQSLVRLPQVERICLVIPLRSSAAIRDSEYGLGNFKTYRHEKVLDYAGFWPLCDNGICSVGDQQSIQTSFL